MGGAKSSKHVQHSIHRLRWLGLLQELRCSEARQDASDAALGGLAEAFQDASDDVLEDLLPRRPDRPIRNQERPRDPEAWQASRGGENESRVEVDLQALLCQS